jgi:hypothetical protein
MLSLLISNAYLDNGRPGVMVDLRGRNNFCLSFPFSDRAAAQSDSIQHRITHACSTQPYACVDQEGQSRTRLNVLHADAALMA